MFVRTGVRHPSGQRKAAPRQDVRLSRGTDSPETAQDGPAYAGARGAVAGGDGGGGAIDARGRLRHHEDMTYADTLSALFEATRRLVRTVDGLADDELAAPSGLPDWSRAHVVAHLALNAESLAGVLHGAVGGQDVPMYPSQAARDADIQELAAAGPPALRDRFLASCTLIHEALGRVPEEAWGGTFRRLPGTPPLPLGALPGMRHREVEVHHADLGAGYGPADWPEPFLDATFNQVVGDRAEGTAVLLRTPEGDVPLGDGDGPVVSGSRTDLTWWLLGRGDGAGLTGDPALPTLGPWR